MRFSLLGTMLFATLAGTLSAHADTITFASAPGTTTYTYMSGQGSANGTTASAAAYTNCGYGTAISGSQWISTSSSGGNGNLGITDYTTSFNLLSNELYSGSVSFMADDNAGIIINGVQVRPIDSTSDYSSPQTFALLSSYFHAGTNTFTLEDSNSGGGPAAADFAGTLTGVPATPEPSSLALMGTGMLGLAGVIRRRFKRSPDVTV